MANFLVRHFNFLSKKLTTADADTVMRMLTEKANYATLASRIATSYISNAISKCEIKVYEGGKEQNGPLSYLLNVSPNPNQCGSQLVNDLVRRICRDGEALMIPHRKKFLYVADGFTQIVNPLKQNTFENVSIEGECASRSYKASEVYYFALDDFGMNYVMGEIFRDYDKLMSSAIDGFNASRGRKYKLKIESGRAGDAKFNEDYEKSIKKNLEDFMNSRDAVYPEFQGYTLEEMKSQTTGAASDVIDLRKDIFDVVAQAYKIPITMMYGNMTNTSEVIRQFLTFSIDPLAQMISDELTRKSFTQTEWERGSRVVVDTKRINHVDILEVADKVEKLVSSGTFSIDDILVNLGYQPLNTPFSKAHWVTKNYSLAEEAMQMISEKGGEK